MIFSFSTLPSFFVLIIKLFSLESFFFGNEKMITGQDDIYRFLV